MSKQTNPAVIGGFVIGAVLLLALGFVVFGGSQLFAAKTRYVAYFVEPTDGLRTGANVLLNGVRIGYVSDIDLLIDEVNFETMTQVTLEILPDSYIITRGGETSGENMHAAIAHNVLVDDAGLRASLDVESFVTGQLWVVLELRPETQPVFRGVDPPYPEVPTIASNIQEILNKVQDWVTDVQENIDVGELSKRLTSALAGIDRLANSTEIRETIAGINRLINDESTVKLVPELRRALTELRGAAGSAAVLFREAEGDIDSLAADMSEIQGRIDGTLAEAETLLETAARQFRSDSEQVYRLNAALDELERAARSMREFFDYLERNPEALLRGRSAGEAR